MLDAYQAERQPITDQVSHFAFNMAKQVSQQRREISADIERDDATGEATRAQIGKEAYDLYVQQQCCGGLNFGYFYAGSPIIAYDGAAHPAYSMGRFESSSVPGCRAPHFWLRDWRSLYDALGEGYGLLRFDRRAAVDGLGRGGSADAVCRSPFSTSTMRNRQSFTPEGSCWCGPTGMSPGAPMSSRTMPLGLIDHLRGAGVASMRSSPPCRGASRRLGRLARVCHGRYSAAWAGGAELMKPPDWRRHSSA